MATEAAVNRRKDRLFKKLEDELDKVSQLLKVKPEREERLVKGDEKRLRYIIERLQYIQDKAASVANSRGKNAKTNSTQTKAS